MSNNTKALSLKNLLSENKYIIPIYQRNYAWSKAEISQLIRDINEFSSTNPDKNYYIGSLVCFKRENNDFELIDGQQRHTTISLINLVLKNWKFKEDGQKKIENTISYTNLKFDSRKNVQYFLEELYLASDLKSFIGNSNIIGTQSFKDAIDFIIEEFDAKDEKGTLFNVSAFAEYFYNKVKFFRVEVPMDTDLNHYFEIMNNRGEQLEKHEIVKSVLMSRIKNENNEVEKQELEIFATIWDACSEMNNYVYFYFDKTNRRELFADNGNLKATDFSNIIITKTDNENKDLSLFDILKADILPEDFPKEERQTKEKYKSVVDFPNFLLQVLKLKDETVSLDDKNLLKAFEKEVKPKEFIFDLLKYRTIFDKYIIKQDLSDSDEEKQNWSIRTLESENDVVEKTFKENDNELIKIQTMLYYSNPTNNNNNWVQKILKERYFELFVTDYTDKVFSEIAKPRFDKDNLSYPNITAYNLYFIDLLLWKLYKIEDVKDDMKSLKNKIENLKSQFNKFKFKQLNSKEHLLPQSKATESEKEVLNDLGNLCLISTSQNSSANDKHPLYKREQFENDNSSLKRLIMFESFENDKWEKKQIENHKKEIQELINLFSPNV